MSDSKMPVAVPELADVVKDRALLAGLSVQVLAGLVVEIAAVQQGLGAALARAERTPERGPAELDRALTIEEAAARLNIAPATMQRWLRKPPWDAAVVVRSRTMVRVSQAQLNKLLEKSAPRPSRTPRLGTGLLGGQGRPLAAASLRLGGKLDGLAGGT